MENHTDKAQLATDCEPLHAGESPQNDLVAALNKLRGRELDGLFLDQTPEQQEVAQPYFGFSINGEELVVSARHFCEVFTDVPIAPLPNAPKMLLGLVNLRGSLLPVYQLHDHLSADPVANGASTSAQKNSRKKIVLVVGKGDRAVGLLIDGLPSSLSLALPVASSSSQSSMPHPALPELAHVYFLPDRTLAHLAVDLLPERLLSMANLSSA